MNLLLPVGSRLMSSWASHQKRNPKSSEPGTDFYCPIGTEIIAPADGTIYGYGESITPATGRWVGIDFDHGESFRCLHLKSVARKSGRVRAGDVIGISGASGYGEEDWSWNVSGTGGAHTHVTLWPSHDKRFGYRPDGTPYTVDFMTRVGATPAAAPASTPFSPTATLAELQNGEDMFVAMIKNKGWFLIVPQGNAKPRAIVLDGGSQVDKTTIPRVLFETKNSIDMLNAAVQF